ncbi:expression site-associated gene 1 (ESAG1) protein, putative [Trypanosoma equiperdum]|uniref:Expression site-associated gene 1 (ESAG1) protein, putative n=1 Tax=Trypanosoma equiperdum TaxID=5694 RepID=A0A1G4I7R0_TRYEQ|nr:expression site-associated gene 1 (ESAG1) protein, putative [Trypanosoma equiperdum]
MLVLSIVGAFGEDDRTLVTDFKGDAPLSESVCYLSCLSNALNKLYADGENKLFMNEEVYANSSRILDDMEGRAGASVRYLSIISGSTEGKQDKNLENLISHGNGMGDIVAKAGGNKYYTAIAEVARTVWDDVNRPLKQDEAKCGNQNFGSVAEPKNECVHHTCPLGDGVNDEALKHYKKGGIEINVQTGSVGECFNLPRMNLYKNGAGKHASDVFEWPQSDAGRFQLTLEVKKIFSPIIVPFAAGLPPSVLLAMMSNITSLESQFNMVHSNFTLLLHENNITLNVNKTSSDF